MSVQKEPSGRRSIAVEVEVPGTPEEVWPAIASGPGVTAWFVPTEVEERPGGSVVCDFGPGMETRATIEAWEPPHRFVASGEMGPGAPTMTTEWTVEARSADTCVVRVAHSLVAATDDWDEQLAGTEKGWPTWFGVLRLYLEHFRGEPSASIRYFGMSPATPAALWESLASGLGLEGATAGERRAAPAGPPPLAGVVDSASTAGDTPHVLLRLDRPAPGAATLGTASMGGQTCLVAYLFFYGERAAATAEREEAAWRRWLDGMVG